MIQAHTKGKSAFTIIEVLVSSTLIVVIMGMLFSVVDNTQKLWQKTTSSINQFQSARTGFEGMTRRLSQATLNTYWRALENPQTSGVSNFNLVRQAELQFLSGSTSQIFTSAPTIENLPGSNNKAFPTHSMFFQAPLGYTEEKEKNSPTELLKFRQLDRMLMGCGYFIEFGKDPDRPDFLNSTTALQNGTPARERFRLMELNLPSEKLNIYDRRLPETDLNNRDYPQILDAPDSVNATPGTYQSLVTSNEALRSSWRRPYWLGLNSLKRTTPQTNQSGSKFQYGRVMAENVIALIILPKVPRSTGTDTKQAGSASTAGSTSAAPFYAFDSWRTLTETSDDALKRAQRDNLLPSVVQITMIAIDEPSAIRMNSSLNDPSSIFEADKDQGGGDLFKNSLNYADDLQSLEAKLQAMKEKPNYRIFTMDVVIRGSKWSRPEK